tara:strand:+ start:1694 stop:1915 length:222 start_codon:yes stop_codon:yes gene_type:complete
MGNAWIEALKEYNKGHNKWCVVKKGTPEYNEVKKIMERKKDEDQRQKKKKEPKFSSKAERDKWIEKQYYLSVQ